MKGFFLKKFFIYFLICLLSICTIYSFSSFFKDINNSEIESTKLQLKNISEQTAISISIKLENSSDYIEGISNLIYKNKYEDNSIIESIFNEFVSRDIFDSVFMFDKTNNNIISTSYDLNFEKIYNNINSCKYSIKTNNNVCIFLEKLNNDVTFVFHSNISDDLSIYGLYKIDRLEEMIYVASYYDECYTHIFDLKGNFVVKSPQYIDSYFIENIFDIFENSKLKKKYNINSIKYNIKNDKEGFIHYIYNDKEERYAYYMPIGINDLYIISEVPCSSVEIHVTPVKVGALILFFSIIVLFVISELVVYINRNKNNKEIFKLNRLMKVNEERYKLASDIANSIVFEYIISEQKIIFKNKMYTKYFDSNEINNIPMSIISFDFIEKEYKAELIRCFNSIILGQKDVEVELKFNNKENDYNWFKVKMTNIFDKNNMPIKAIGTISNITELKETEIKYIKIGQYKDIMISNAIYSCELNLTKNQIKNIRFNKKFENINYCSYTDFINYTKDKYIYEDDVEMFEKYFNIDNLIKSYNNDNKEIKMRYRRFNFDNNSNIWSEIYVYLTRNDETDDIVGILFVLDVDNIVKEELKLKYDAEIDGLTGIYNKSTTEKKIKECIMNGIKGILFVIDLDGFKFINDNYSHIAGDYVLVEFSSKLKKIFRTTDIVGRIGGDEFCVFIKDTNSINLINKKGNKILEILKQEYNYNNNILPVAGSIGISIYPKDGDSYSEIFSRADKALYKAKNLGKAQYSIYENEQ